MEKEQELEHINLHTVAFVPNEEEDDEEEDDEEDDELDDDEGDEDDE